MRLPDLPRVEVFCAHSGHLLVALGMSLFFAGGTPAQTTKKTPLPVAPNVVNPYNCSIAEFRTLALTTHDPQERGDLAAQWLKANAPACSVSAMYLRAMMARPIGWPVSSRMTTEVSSAERISVRLIPLGSDGIPNGFSAVIGHLAGHQVG